MFDEPLPKQADVRKLASREAHFSVRLPLNQLPRIADAVLGADGLIEVDLQFGIDDQKLRTIQGNINTRLQVECQRCMEPVEIDVEASVKLAIVWDEEQAQQLNRDYDPLIVGDGELVDLNQVVEEELLLSVPFVSYHDPAECKGQRSYQSFDKSAEAKANAEEKPNPFSVLASLKSGK